MESNPGAQFVQMTKSSCGPIVGVSSIRGTKTESWAATCNEFNAQVLEWIKKSEQVKFAILSSPFDPYFDPSARLLVNGRVEESDPELVYKSFVKMLEVLRRHDVTPIVFAPPPSSGQDFGKCLSTTKIFDLQKSVCNFQLASTEEFQGRVNKFLARELVSMFRSFSSTISYAQAVFVILIRTGFLFIATLGISHTKAASIWERKWTSTS